MASSVTVGLNAVIVAVTREVPRVLTVPWRDPVPLAREVLPAALAESNEPLDALPFGPLDPAQDLKLQRALRRWVLDQTGLEMGYVEQLYTFGDVHRDPADLHGGARAVSVAYVALVRQSETAGQSGASWRDIYRYFPWEDWREGRPEVIDQRIAPALARWAAVAPGAANRRARRERIEIAFGLGKAGWDGEGVLDRYELLYEVGLVAERWRDYAYGIAAASSLELPPPEIAPAEVRIPLGGFGMALDHRRIVANALGRLRGKLKYRPVVFELLPPTFTLLQLQRVVEALAGIRLHKNNFRRLVEQGGLVERTGQAYYHTGGRPAELFRFRAEVLRERKAPGVGLPGLPAGD
jgi:hypothetical protein